MWITDLDLKMLRALCKMQMFAPKWCKILSKWEILFSCSVRKARKQPQTGKQNTKNTNKMNRQFYPRPVSFCGFLAKRRLRIFMPLEVSAAGPGQRCRKIGAGVFQSRWMLCISSTSISSTLWLCQNSYWKWQVIMDFPIKKCDFP